MKVILVLSGAVAIVGIVLGCLMDGTPQKELGQTLILAGAIIIAGLLISLAIVEKNKK